MVKKGTMIENQNVMYLEMFEENKVLLDLIQVRGELKKQKDQLHKITYNNTTNITESEKKLSFIVEKLKNKISV